MPNLWRAGQMRARTPATRQHMQAPVPELMLAVTGLCLGVTGMQNGKRCKPLISNDDNLA